MTATKRQRHSHIIEVIQEQSVTSQQELRQLLAEAGVEVTQATLSRDLQELGVLKGASGYVLPQSPNQFSANPARLGRALRNELRSIDCGNNLIVIRTDPGHANALAVELDRSRLPDVIGTLAGDDTILVITRRSNDATKLMQQLRVMAYSE